MNGDLFMFPLGRPQVERDNVGNQLKIRNGPVEEFIGDGTGEVLVQLMVVSSKTRFSTRPTIRGGIERDMNGGVGDQEGNAISKLNGILPSRDVGVEVGGQEDWLRVGRGKSFRSETSIEE